MMLFSQNRKRRETINASRRYIRPTYIATYPLRQSPALRKIVRPNGLAKKLIYAAWLGLVWAMLSAAAARGLAVHEAVIAGLVFAGAPWAGRGLVCKN